jgi:DNA primase
MIEEISKYVRLTISGENHKGCCPFHIEKTPSFIVNSKRQIWHCFGCGMGGDVIYFKEMIEARNINPLK